MHILYYMYYIVSSCHPHLLPILGPLEWLNTTLVLCYGQIHYKDQPADFEGPKL